MFLIGIMLFILKLPVPVYCFPLFIPAGAMFGDYLLDKKQAKKMWLNLQNSVAETTDIAELRAVLNNARFTLPESVLGNKKWDFRDEFDNFIRLADIKEASDIISAIKGYQFIDGRIIDRRKLEINWFDDDGIKQSYIVNVDKYKETNHECDELVLMDYEVCFLKSVHPHPEQECLDIQKGENNA